MIYTNGGHIEVDGSPNDVHADFLTLVMTIAKNGGIKPSEFLKKEAELVEGFETHMESKGLNCYGEGEGEDGAEEERDIPKERNREGLGDIMPKRVRRRVGRGSNGRK